MINNVDVIEFSLLGPLATRNEYGRCTSMPQHRPAKKWNLAGSRLYKK
ncbi:hypothetical protein UCMB321_0694 [Pseudomonas batumici]|uniref:Uncharacterized protein n=1 Tax=Pseudomonas batumici TaxID=226910 RepID=A0A0C2IF37_9PSED|nr:hypothetical protein UCMB321_0694 [Pseudomonas batumici]